MKVRMRLANQIVGLFILLAIVGLVAALVLLGANQRWFAEKLVLKSRFKSGAVLDVGNDAAPIRLRVVISFDQWLEAH